jgi:small nuclear ribonucleoprotein (snRNP)-like protein
LILWSILRFTSIVLIAAENEKHRNIDRNSPQQREMTQSIVVQGNFVICIEIHSSN